MHIAITEDDCVRVKNLEYGPKPGTTAVCTFRYHEEKPGVLTVIFPGQAYYKDAPLMWYSAISAFEAGSDTLNLEYTFQARTADSSPVSLETSVEDLLLFLEGFLGEHPYRKLIFIAKSIGTDVVTRVCRRQFKEVEDFIFQTPLMNTIDFMNSARNMLVLVGEDDPIFGAEDIERIANHENLRLITFPEANHILEVEGNYRKSLEYLNKLASETYSFVRKRV